MLNNLGKLHGFDVVHLVPYNCFGPKIKYDDPFRSVVAIWINLILQNKNPVIYGNGEQKRKLSFTCDIVDLISKFINCDFRHGEIFNLGTDLKEISLNELIEKINVLMETNSKPIFLEERPNEIKMAIASCEKILKKFNYKAKNNIIFI